MFERRRSARWELLQIAELHLENISYPVGCLLLNVSSSGALIEVGNTEVIPNSFWLRAWGASVDRECEGVRREPQRLAVRFTGKRTINALCIRRGANRIRNQNDYHDA